MLDQMQGPYMGGASRNLFSRAHQVSTRGWLVAGLPTRIRIPIRRGVRLVTRHGFTRDGWPYTAYGCEPRYAREKPDLCDKVRQMIWAGTDALREGRACPVLYRDKELRPLNRILARLRPLGGIVRIPDRPKDRQRWIDAWHYIQEIKADYARKFADGDCLNPEPSLIEYSDALAEEYGIKLGPKVVSRVLQAGAAGFLG